MKGHSLPGIKQRVEESPVKQKTIKELDNKAGRELLDPKKDKMNPPHVYKPITKEEAEAYKKTPDKKTLKPGAPLMGSSPVKQVSEDPYKGIKFYDKNGKRRALSPKEQEIINANKNKTYNGAYDKVTADMTDEQLLEIAREQNKVNGQASANKWNINVRDLQKKRSNLQKIGPVTEVPDEVVKTHVIKPRVKEEVVRQPKDLSDFGFLSPDQVANLEVNQGKKASPVKGKFIDAIKKGNFRDAGNTLKHEIKGIGSGIKAALKDDYNTTSKARDIEHAYNWTKNRSAEKQRIKDAGKK
ncbi:MAG TPA: hypothetical protein DCG56_05730 [Flavobacteriaceae bacterium]|nr:hypothetical protein [Flavobacteriaceae bacterium]